MICAAVTLGFQKCQFHISTMLVRLDIVTGHCPFSVPAQFVVTMLVTGNRISKLPPQMIKFTLTGFTTQSLY
jgi:hypothetical protein